MDRNDVTEAIIVAKRKKGLTWAAIAAKVQRRPKSDASTSFARSTSFRRPMLPAAARELLKFLHSEGSLKVIRLQGMERVL